MSLILVHTSTTLCRYSCTKLYVEIDMTRILLCICLPNFVCLSKLYVSFQTLCIFLNIVLFDVFEIVFSVGFKVHIFWKGHKIKKKSLTCFDATGKVIYTKYSKHWPYTVAHTLDCVCSKMLIHGLNHGFFLSLFKLISCPIHWIVCVLAYLNFIFQF